MQSSLIIGIVIGVAYTFGGFFVCLIIDAKRAFLSKFINDNDYLASLMILFWPVIIPLAYLLFHLRKRAEHNNVNLF